MLFWINSFPPISLLLLICLFCLFMMFKISECYKDFNENMENIVAIINIVFLPFLFFANTKDLLLTLEMKVFYALWWLSITSKLQIFLNFLMNSICKIKQLCYPFQISFQNLTIFVYMKQTIFCWKVNGKRFSLGVRSTF